MPTCIICKTLEGDVKKGLEELRRQGEETINGLRNQETPHLVQVGMRKYGKLKEASMDETIKEIEKKHITHFLNINTLTIHRKDCPHAGKNILKAHITNPETTGLRRCKYGYR
jgi:hypothetical protein